MQKGEGWVWGGTCLSMTDPPGVPHGKGGTLSVPEGSPMMSANKNRTERAGTSGAYLGFLRIDNGCSYAGRTGQLCIIKEKDQHYPCIL
jgi:hypothetical protein